MKIIFCDVDGVLNNARTTGRSPGGYKGVSDELIRKLKRIVEKTDARIVLSSDWRLVKDDPVHGKDYRYLTRKLLFVAGLKISDHTEDISWSRRGKEIRKYLAVQSLAPRQVIIRTCDIGADKMVDYMKLDPEENPALGYRAIRICLTRKDFFKTQLRAMLRASAYGNLAIMFPMIISLMELNESKMLLEECRQELLAEGKKLGDVSVGIMIETPAAVLCADELAQACDFFSIGTNDLTQYVCAIDRQNAKLEPFSDTHHPAVLRAIKMTIDAGHRHGIWVGICGELGADLSLTETFLRMGIDELSVNPKSVLPLRKQIRSLDLRQEPGKALME